MGQQGEPASAPGPVAFRGPCEWWAADPRASLLTEGCFQSPCPVQAEAAVDWGRGSGALLSHVASGRKPQPCSRGSANSEDPLGQQESPGRGQPPQQTHGFLQSRPGDQPHVSMTISGAAGREAEVPPSHSGRDSGEHGACPSGGGGNSCPLPHHPVPPLRPATAGGGLKGEPQGLWARRTAGSIPGVPDACQAIQERGGLDSSPGGGGKGLKPGKLAGETRLGTFCPQCTSASPWPRQTAPT